MTTEISVDVPVRAEGIAFVERPGRVALLDPSRPSEAPTILVGFAADVWMAIDGIRTIEQIADHVAPTDLPIEQVRPLVAEVVKGLRGRRLLEDRAW
ncbi:hypothetical protein K8Z61_10525 [Nocardioides sp. TRM66260-LWL]|uniref:PqqD family peptide modification chaperone n=1 Tax=Nocardioides sp. TRM66260-LWL TaxID=2874478 RepID=UPI001CC512B0|nr:PqqD family peptide modification chaperone [Nocardioides sp. TRM66260-LWL]MBZ5734931.1 hypothetical protein [Nocardioides sp. TRM66260-LWL]